MNILLNKYYIVSKLVKTCKFKPKNPWMTTGLLNSCIKNNLMYKAVLKDSYSYEDYTIYRYKLTSTISTPKSVYLLIL